MRWLDIITTSMDINLRKLRETVEDREAWNAAVHGGRRVRHDLTTEQQHSRGKDTIRAQFSSLLPAPTCSLPPSTPGPWPEPIQVPSWSLAAPRRDLGPPPCPPARIFSGGRAHTPLRLAFPACWVGVPESQL